MKMYSIYDAEFKLYGQVLEGYDTAELREAMMKIDLPEGVNYEPGIDSLEACAIYPVLRDRAYGGMPIQLGLCWGHNTKLNCLEYHRDSEVNIGTHDGARGRARGGIRHLAALRALPHERRRRLPRGHRAAQGHQHRKAGLRARQRGGQMDDRPQQVAAGPSRFRRGEGRRPHRLKGREHRHRLIRPIKKPAANCSGQFFMAISRR